MPEFNVDLSPKNQPTSLADLLKLQMYSYQGDIAQQEAAKAKAIGAELPIVQSFFKDTKNWQNDQGEIDVDKINSALPVLAPLTGEGYAAKYNTLAKNNTEAKDAKLNFDQKERQIVASVQSALGYAGVTDPRVYMDKFNNLKAQFPDSKNIHRYADAAISNLQIGAQANGGKPNPDLPKNAIQAANEMLSLADQQSRFSPTATTAQVGGQTVSVINRPSVATSEPKVEVAPLGGGGSGNAPTPASTQTQTKQTSKLPKLIPEDESLKFVPNQSGIVNLNDYQKKAYDRGDKEIATANATLQGQADLQENIRKVERHIEVASGSKVGQAYERTKQYLLGNEQLDTLKKSIAQVQARNAELMGLNRSDASQQLNEKLSGNENIDPKALEGIMQQVKAESKAAELFTKGLNKFVNMRGDINGKIQAEKFKSKWAEHYDPRIFQIDNIVESKLPDAEKQRKIDEIQNKMTDKEHDKYIQNRKIIRSMYRGEYQ